MAALKEFITQFLSLGGIKDEWIQKLTTEKSMKQFETSLTHSSYNKNENYEVFELFGDVIVNHSVLFWMRSRFPQITSIEWLTRTKHFLISTKSLSDIGKEIGITKFIKINQTYGKEFDMDKITEDCFESLIGCVSFEMENIGLKHGIAHEVCQTIISGYLDKKFLNNQHPEDWPFTYEQICDSVTRLKELYDSMRWPLGFVEYKNPHDQTTAIQLRSWHLFKPAYLSENLKDVIFQAYIPARNDLPKMSQFYSQNGIVLTKKMIEAVESKLGRQTLRFLYTRKDESSERDQFVTYFGPGTVIAQVVIGNRELQKGKADAATRGLELLKKEGLFFQKNISLVYTFNEKKANFGNFVADK